MTPTTTTLTYIDLLDRAVKLAGGRPALIDDTVTLTHRELASLTNRLAHALIAKGFAPSSPYAVLSPNTSMALAALLGGLRAGGAWSNLNLRNAPAMNIDILNRSGCRALFFHSSTAHLLPDIRKGVSSLNLAICLDKEAEGYPSLRHFIEGAPDTTVNVRLPREATGFQGSTGGTTGAPKITQAGQDFLALNMLGFMTSFNAFSVEEPPVNLAVAPITHAGGIVAMATLCMCGSVVMMAAADLGLLLDERAEAQGLAALPAAHRHLHADEPSEGEGTDFSSLRYLMSAAAPFATEKIAQAHKTFGPVICQSLGQTESGSAPSCRLRRHGRVEGPGARPPPEIGRSADGEPERDRSDERAGRAARSRRGGRDRPARADDDVPLSE